MHVPVAGQWTDVLAQCFERRCLTYTPGNQPGWQVEAGNIGQHYYMWRYGESPQEPVTPSPPPPGDDLDELAYVAGLVEILEATDISIYVFLLLLENPTFTNQWYHDFDQVMELWRLFHPALDSLNPPPAWEPFHYKLLDAYWWLGQSADDFTEGFYNFNEAKLYEGLDKFEEFAIRFDEAGALIPEATLVSLEPDSGQIEIDTSSVSNVLDEEVWRDAMDKIERE